MNGRFFLDVANHLLTQPTEAAWRSAVSRAYYGVFHVARELLRDLGFRVPGGPQAHAYLWMRLINCGDLPIQVPGQRLHALRSERNRADYDFAVPLSRTSATIQVRSAEQIIPLLDAARAEPTRTQITDPMRVYERDVLRDVTWQQP